MGGDFLKIKNLNICDNYYYKKAININLEGDLILLKWFLKIDNMVIKYKRNEKIFLNLKISILK